jgi:hypothetical protein
MSLMTLVACGSGDGDLTGGDDGGGTTEDTIIVTLAISNVNVIEQSPATITATVIEEGSPKQGIVVTFSTTLGNFTPGSGTALTNSAGVASIVLNSGSISGAGVVVATLSTGEDSAIGFTTQAASSSVVVRLGNGTGVGFTEGVANVSLAQISAGGTTVVSVSLVDEQGNLYSETVELNFSSRCTVDGTATLTPVVTTSNGLATSTYLAKGCIGDDVIQVNATIGGTNLSATGLVNVLQADAGSIAFVSATPEHIAILGTGGDESSIVIFKVLDVNGDPINDRDVTFELSTDLGGINISPLTATTNANGEVQTVVNSGTVSTSIRVKATITGSDPIISSQSNTLVLSTGIPDQDSFSLSASILNPEGWDIDGTEVEVTARLADAFNNPAPDGTAVSFTTEGGSIDSFCITSNGVCSVTWRSQYPRPEGHILGDVNNPAHLPETMNSMGQKLGGRATILATAIGEESFPDLNGNGRFDAAEMTAFTGNNISGRPYDLKEAFVDHNEDGLYNPTEGGDVNQSGALEEFTDFNNDGVFTPYSGSYRDGLYNGVLCSEPSHAGCSINQQSINVRANLVLVMSGSDPIVNTLTPVINITGEGTGVATIIISDLHNQPMPFDTKIVFKAGVGSFVSTSSFAWPNDNHNGGRQYSVAIKGEADATSGTLSVEIETDSGVTSIPIATINIL